MTGKCVCYSVTEAVDIPSKCLTAGAKGEILSTCIKVHISLTR
jgi:hypothetical protein